ncbi:MAG TPA: UDP-glucose/GDP-mannose dehydrogenase family protein [Candidatus Paceibacterota bacterium]|nr:UDP-glucose/GDP-mannose dehydrogenase family protein [Verrucomicrobiota bacterium]HRY50114.1 UDP-glucose/GDP-mannose dehydrogenase family protein [Candidatus Paceibacterota bacterium]HSA02513.1 UDP-glucose/GDP-mannose dehydrogenase family protein [Candidatus Paceibacterota bacterium]
MKIAIIGTGYVGLVTGACFAEIGHQVVCVDCDAEKIHTLKTGLMPIYEPGLDELVARNVAAGRLEFSTSTQEGVEKSTVIFIAVPTPPLPDGSVDLSFIEGVARDIARCMTGYRIIVDKSTVPVKTGEKVAETITRYCKSRVAFDVVSNPEFLREGFAVEDCLHPDRVVIGTNSARPVPTMKEIYAPLEAPIIVTDISSAELIKHAANSFLALKISYINAISVICEASGANVMEVANGIGMDSRIGRAFLDASLGFGGSCFPKDLSAFVKISEQLGYDFALLREVQHINAIQMDRFFKKIQDTLWVLKDKNIGVLGLAFKQNTDDVRQSPAIELCHRLQKEGAVLRVFDPKAMGKARAVLSNVTYLEDMNTVAEGCDALVIATEWPEFKQLDLQRVRATMVCPIVFDGRNLFDPAEMEQLGFIYKSIGR